MSFYGFGYTLGPRFQSFIYFFPVGVDGGTSCPMPDVSAGWANVTWRRSAEWSWFFAFFTIAEMRTSRVSSGSSSHHLRMAGNPKPCSTTLVGVVMLCLIIISFRAITFFNRNDFFIIWFQACLFLFQEAGRGKGSKPRAHLTCRRWSGSASTTLTPCFWMTVTANTSSTSATSQRTTSIIFLKKLHVQTLKSSLSLTVECCWGFGCFTTWSRRWLVKMLTLSWRVLTSGI